MLPILFLVLFAITAGSDLVPSTGPRWWETVAAPLDHGASEVAVGTGLAPSLHLVRSGDGSAAGGSDVPSDVVGSSTRGPAAPDPLGRGAAAPLAMRPHAERLPYHATAPPVRA